MYLYVCLSCGEELELEDYEPHSVLRNVHELRCPDCLKWEMEAYELVY